MSPPQPSKPDPAQAPSTAPEDPLDPILEGIERRLDEVCLSPDTRRSFLRELGPLRGMTRRNSVADRTLSHLEWALELPWPEPPRAQPAGDFERLRRKLSRSHVGLESVKQRITEILAIRQLGGGARGTVLCFQGPPGTGKSSIARTVASALGRSFLTIPVGAMVHERELVGVSRRREGASPGAILSGLHRVGTPDPVVLLDEIDKVSLGGEGTAAGALLLLLDPEHNAEFLDHYLGVPFDLSRCLFLATANDVEELPEALVDRMEVLPFHGYTETEKVAIARKHLIGRATEHAGIDRAALRITAGAMRSLVRDYTEEAGVRHLQRLLVSLARKAAVDVVGGGRGLVAHKADLREHLGPPTVEEELRLRRPAVGVATGLAWTSVGGALLPIEALAMPGSGRLILTGQIGEVMRESVQTTISFIRTRFPALGLEPNHLEELDLHLHFPSAATPKDGPSAGIAIAAALVSLLTGRPTRHDVAMTGEVSLLGAVLPVGGLREKLLAAIRSGIPEVVLPARNSEDAQRLASEIPGAPVVHEVRNVDEALQLALLDPGHGGEPGALGRVGPRRAARRARSGDQPG